jgi:predicted nucleic acid-binding protein
MILLDTSALVASICGERPAWPRLLALIEEKHLLRLPSLVLYEFLRGPRVAVELARQDDLFPLHAVVPFTDSEAVVGAQLYRQVRRARARAVDIAIAACALTQDASLWTLNRGDFDDIPRLRLIH